MILINSFAFQDLRSTSDYQLAVEYLRQSCPLTFRTYVVRPRILLIL